MSSVIQKAKVRLGTAVIDSMITELEKCKLHREATASEKPKDGSGSGKSTTGKLRKHGSDSHHGHRSRKNESAPEHSVNGGAGTESMPLPEKKEDSRASPSITDPSISDPFDDDADDEPPETEATAQEAATNQPHRRRRRRKRSRSPPLGPPPKYTFKAGFISHVKACIEYEKAAKVKEQHKKERRERRARREAKKKHRADKEGIAYEKTAHGEEVEEKEAEQAKSLIRVSSVTAEVNGPAYTPERTWSFPRHVKENMERIDKEIAEREE